MRWPNQIGTRYLSGETRSTEFVMRVFDAKAYNKKLRWWWANLIIGFALTFLLIFHPLVWMKMYAFVGVPLWIAGILHKPNWNAFYRDLSWGDYRFGEAPKLKI